MKTRLTAAVLSAAMLFANAAAMPAQAQDLTQVFSSLSADQSASLSYAMAGLGIADYNALIAMVQATALPPQSRIRDLNSDSVCDTDDVIFLMNFLQGKVNYAYNYSDMDVTNDCVIDEADTRAYLAYYTYQSITNGTPVPFQSGHTAGKSYQTQTIQYKRYNAQTGAYLGIYALTTPSPTQSSPVSTGTTVTGTDSMLIFDNGDTRTVDWSESSIVKIIVYDSVLNTYKCATGFIINSHVVATAAHIVNNATDIQILLFETSCNLDGTGILDTTYHADGSITPVEYHIPADFDPSDNYHDYALITVSEDVSNYAHMQMGIPLPSAIDQQVEVTVSGFPIHIGRYNEIILTPDPAASNDPDNTITYHKKYSCSGHLIPFFTPNYLTAEQQAAFNSGVNTSDYLYYTLFASNGDSGAPVYYSHQYSNTNCETVLAIMTFTPSPFYCRVFHGGPMISSDLLRFYYNNESNLHY